MSAKSVAEKLQIKPGTTLWSSDPARVELVEPLPEGVRVVGAADEASGALVFADDAAAARAALDEHAASLADAAASWMLYPKGNRSDVNRDSLARILFEHDLRPVSQIAVDDVWSALRFRPLRPGEQFRPQT